MRIFKQSTGYHLHQQTQQLLLIYSVSFAAVLDRHATLLSVTTQITAEETIQPADGSCTSPSSASGWSQLGRRTFFQSPAVRCGPVEHSAFLPYVSVLFRHKAALKCRYFGSKSLNFGLKAEHHVMKRSL